jgi:hypothetical protein
MGFTTPCFIRKSTKELTEKVYKLGGRDGRSFWHCDYLTLLLAEKQQFTCLDDEHGNAEMLIEKGFIDCGTNEELFLAIAALRDDTNYMQWFVCTSDYKESDGKEWKVGDFDLNTCPDDFNNILPHWRKATVNELIEHFKEKE